MQIRKIIDSDRDSLIGLVSMMISDTNKEAVSNEIVSDFYSNKSFITDVMVEDKTVCGYISYKTNPLEGSNGVIEIVFLGVSLSHRKRGIGQALVKHIENSVSKNNIRKIYIKTSPQNKTAVCFWIQQGYEFEARLKDFSLKDQDAYLLSKDI